MQPDQKIADALRKAGEIEPSMPVRGYIINEDDQQIWLRDQEGIWLISKNDIVTTGEWGGANDPRFTGKPTLVFVREGADIYSLNKFSVQFSTPPITLKQLAHGTPVKVNGTEIIEADVDEGAREIGFRPGAGLVPTTSLRMMRAGRVTVCCWDSNWGTTCQGDDSGY